MDKQEIIEGNKLIAEFMALKWLGETYISDKYTDMGVKDGPFEYEADYHDDWSSLMPVVEKIETSADQETGHVEVHIIENWCRMYRMSYTKEFISVYDPKSKIAAVWQAVVQFITWCNSQKQ